MNVIEDRKRWLELVQDHYPDVDCGHCSCGWEESGYGLDRVYVMDHFRNVLIEAMNRE